MTPVPIRFVAGDPERFAPIEEALQRALAEATPIQTNPRRTLYTLRLPTETRASERTLVAKIFHARGGIRSARDTLKRLIGQSAVEREWRGLTQIRSLSLPTTPALAWGWLPNGESILVTQFVEGSSLVAALDRWTSEERGEAARHLAGSVKRLHASRLQHGDLHHGNLLVTREEILFLDLQRARRLGGQQHALADWARLDASLARTVSRLLRNEEKSSAATLSQFQRDVREASGIGKEIDSARIVLDRDDQRGRARRHLRVGRRWKKVRFTPEIEGVFESEIDEAELRSVFHALGTSPTREVRRAGRVRIEHHRLGDRPIIVKSVQAAQFGRTLADRMRGSAGARAFRAGQMQGLLRTDCARPLGFLEERRWGCPTESICFMESVGEKDLDRFIAEDPAQGHRVALALLAWLAEIHAAGVRHGDLKASNLRIARLGGGFRFWLIDLEDLRPIEAVSDPERIGALAQLNASISEEHLANDARVAAFKIYAERLPFRETSGSVLREIARQSRRKRHRWTGRNCD